MTIISHAIDLVARQQADIGLAIITHLAHILNEEARMISDEFQHTDQEINSDILVDRLDRILTRMNYELRNNVVYLSVHEFVEYLFFYCIES